MLPATKITHPEVHSVIDCVRCEKRALCKKHQDRYLRNWMKHPEVPVPKDTACALCGIIPPYIFVVNLIYLGGETWGISFSMEQYRAVPRLRYRETWIAFMCCKCMLSLGPIVAKPVLPLPQPIIRLIDEYAAEPCPKCVTGSRKRKRRSSPSSSSSSSLAKLT